MANSSMLPLLSLCALVLLHASLARSEQQLAPQPGYRDSSECVILSIDTIEPTQRIESEGGVTEHWDYNEQQLACAGVAATRRTVQPKGLVLAEYSNAPTLVYIVQGRGMTGVVLPGCPETYTYQSIQSKKDRQKLSDGHQKIQFIKEGDVIAIPQGVVHWCYNDGESPLVAVSIMDTANSLNQLDRNPRKFHLAGGEYEEAREQKGSRKTILSAFDTKNLAAALGLSTETVKKIQSEDDNRGNIILVKEGLQTVRPPSRREEERQQEEGSNGLEESLCYTRLKENIGEPSRADVYSPSAGHISILDSKSLPLLSYLQMSFKRFVLYSEAIVSPHWNPNAHSVNYVVRGSAEVEIATNFNEPIFKGEVRQGQIFTVPQNYAVVIKAGKRGCEYVSFKTNDSPMTSPLAGSGSVLSSLPVEVLMNAYQITREEAMKLKNNRGDEMMLLTPTSKMSQGRAFA